MYQDIYLQIYCTYVFIKLGVNMILRVTIHNYEFPTDQVFHNDALVYMINDLIKSGDRFLLGKRYFSKFFTLSKLNTVYWESKTPRSSVMLYDH